MAAGLWVVAEHRDGVVRKVAFEMLSEARRLAGPLGEPVAAILLGEGVGDLTESLGHYGADRVYLGEHPLLGTYTTDGFATVLCEAIRAHDPSLVMFGATTQGKDLAPRVAARLDVGLAAECIALSLGEDGSLRAIRPVFAGKARAEVTWVDRRPRLVGIRPNVLLMGEPDPARQAEVVAVPVSLTPDQIRTRVTEVVKESGGRVELTEAETVVSGGRGMKGPENYVILEALATVIRAAVGASRAAVDAGWKPHSFQIGQTGKVISPKLYIGCGISGAIQHLAGMGTSKCIVAINKDAEAPIFKVANYGIVDDLFKAVPALTEEFKKLLAE